MLSTVAGLVVACGGLAFAAADEPPASAEGESVWEYLRAKYDADGDGTITESEYDRAGGRFDRIDRNGDGVVTEDDFGRRRGGGREAMMRGMRTQRVIVWYFQVDDQPRRLALAELNEAFTAYDADGDDRVDAGEFAARHAEQRQTLDDDDSPMMKMVMGSADPWEALLAGVDENKDGAVSRAEMVALFEGQDDGDGVWNIRSRAGRRGDRGGARRPKSGPTVGTRAPDFELYPPDGAAAGTKPVRLSDFRDNLPVALVFGSYT
jgi:Ca2+-binding EF-hand superfamily protein